MSLTTITMIAVIGSVVSLLNRHRRRLHRLEAIQVFLTSPPEHREQAMRTLIQPTTPNGGAWFLLGCCCLRSGHVKSAARAYGMAYHCDYQLENAALLTFACLKASEGENSDIVEQILVTWQELNRPDVMKQALDRCMMECLASTACDAPQLSPLGRLIWLVVEPTQQASLEEKLTHEDQQESPLHPNLTIIAE